jgi:hypothetical protein
MFKITLILCIIHLLYYVYVGIIYQFIKIGTIYNTPNEEIFRLRSKYNVNIKTFRKDVNHWGFSWGKTIYLNERLFQLKKGVTNSTYKALNWTFHHEYYHLKHHTVKTILFRVLFSLTPILLLIHWALFAIVYITFAYVMYVIVNKVFEKQANEYANKMIEK